MAALDESTDDAELDRHGAAAIDEGDEVAVDGHGFGSFWMLRWLS